MGKMQDLSGANQRWNAQLEEFPQSSSYQELFGIHVKTGHPVFKGISAVSRGIQKRNGHRTHKTCFAQFTQQMSSVFTEQYQAGVKRLLSEFRVKLS